MNTLVLIVLTTDICGQPGPEQKGIVETQRSETPIDSSIRMVKTGRAFIESIIPINSSTLIVAPEIRNDLGEVVGSGVTGGVGVKVWDGATVGPSGGVRVDPPWAQAIAMLKIRKPIPR